jgi:NAD(P)-dependent dehydrogenase (short-subunit alcohol dehydrogenase family)
MSEKNWTLTNIPDLKGKTIIVTGGNSGLGYQSVKAFAEKAANIIMACRSVAKGEEASLQIKADIPTAQITVMELDLTNFWSIRSFATEFNTKFDRLDILLNNAGIMLTPYQLTKDGLELQQATNHFGHFALTGLLLEKLRNTASSRVVNVSSLAHIQGTVDFKNLLYEKGRKYSAMKAYSRSKLENLLFTFELQRFFETNHIDCIATVAHPGVSDTNLFSHIGSRFFRALFMPIFKGFVQPAHMGALPQLRAAVDASAKGGYFYGPNGMGQIKGFPIVVKAKPHAYNKQDAQELWNFSEKITGVKY